MFSTIKSSLSSSFNSRALFAFSLNPSTAPTPVPSSVYIPANRTRDLSKSGCSSWTKSSQWVTSASNWQQEGGVRKLNSASMRIVSFLDSGYRRTLEYFSAPSSRAFRWMCWRLPIAMSLKHGDHSSLVTSLPPEISSFSSTLWTVRLYFSCSPSNSLFSCWGASKLKNATRTTCMYLSYLHFLSVHSVHTLQSV